MSSKPPAQPPAAKPPAPTAAAAAATAPAPSAPTAKKPTTKKTGGASGAAKPTKKRVRRKKPAGGASSRSTPSATSAQAIRSAARAAQFELAQHAATAAARRSDPLWYRVEEPLQSIAADNLMVAGGTSILSDQVELVEKALAKNNMTRADVTPQAFACLLEQARRYALELLADAQDYAYSANRHDITRADLILAEELRSDQPLAAVTQTPKMVVHANQINRIPLPPIPSHCYSGIVLPPEPYVLTARTFDVVSSAQVAQRMVAQVPQRPPPTNKKDAMTKSAPAKPSYGASRGRQIPIHLKSASTTGDASTTTAAVGTASTAAQSWATTAQPPQPMQVDKPNVGSAASTQWQPATQPPHVGLPAGTAAPKFQQGIDHGGLKRKANEMS